MADVFYYTTIEIMKSIFNNLKYLHIVRGLAALIVVVFHAKFVLWVGGTVYKQDHGLHSVWDYFLMGIDSLSMCGEQCVIIFFILSAFVIRHSFQGYRNNLVKFYKLRLLRIYIPFLFSIGFSIIVLIASIWWINPAIYVSDFRQYNARLSDAYFQLSWSQLFNTVFLTTQWKEYAGANYAYWSLGHELIFYILFPLYNFLGKNKKILLAVVLIIAYNILFWRILYFQIYFIGGLLAYDYFNEYSAKPLIPKRILYVGFLAVLYLLINYTSSKVSSECADMITFVFCIFLFDYIFYFVRAKNTFLMKLGDLSYTLYLNHLPLLMIFYAFITLWAGKLVFYSRLPYYAGVVFAILASIPLYYLIERPSINLLKKLRH